MDDQSFAGDLPDLIPEIPPDSIVSRTFFEADRFKAILFGFAPGEELSEHTASQPAVLHILQGEAEVVLGSERFDSQPGFWAYMPANLPHSVHAKSTVVMLLSLFKKIGEGS